MCVFERMASRYPFLMFVARVEHEDDESYPNGYFKVSPAEPPATSAPRHLLKSQESDIAAPVRRDYIYNHLSFFDFVRVV